MIHSQIDKLDVQLLKDLTTYTPTQWINPNYQVGHEGPGPSLNTDFIEDARALLNRFTDYLSWVFPQLEASGGIIESPLLSLAALQGHFQVQEGQAGEMGAGGAPGPSEVSGPRAGATLLLKADSHLPISGSIKARGGIYEVLRHAEELVRAAGFDCGSPSSSEPHPRLGGVPLMASEPVRQVLKGHRVVVGSTGNLGLSIGIMSAKLGFVVEVHMSKDAKAWKMDMLRHKGAGVVAHSGDYSQAVSAARQLAAEDPLTYFVDDEHSPHLFAGYAVAAQRLKAQLDAQGILVDADHPLFVYLPCGVGGGPGGVAYGLKALYGPNVHCIFAEPTHAPCMLVGMATGLGSQIAIQDLNLDGITAADGLAVGRASQMVADLMKPLLLGIATVDDKHLFRLLKEMVDVENIWLEPSALAGLAAYQNLWENPSHQVLQHLKSKAKATHIIWATGGSMVPPSIQEQDYQKGEQI